MSLLASERLKNALSEVEQDYLCRVEEKLSPVEKWSRITRDMLKPNHSFDLHQEIYNEVYKNAVIKPTWVPNSSSNDSNIAKIMNELGFATYDEFYWWSVGNETRSDFWRLCINKLNIKFDTPYTSVFDVSAGVPSVEYLPGAKLNIAESCFVKRGLDEPAVVYASEAAPDNIQSVSFQDLQALSNQVANAIINKLGFVSGDAIGICMPMNPESIAIYLGIVKAGCSVVSIADSFSAIEIETRVRLSSAKAVFTQDVIYRGNKFLPLFERVLEANPSKTVILPGLLHLNKESSNAIPPLHVSVTKIQRNNQDWSWADFLQESSTQFTSVIVPSNHVCNILFSSGTTGEPKAIVWTHSTPIKCAIDGYLHQDIHNGEVVAWPTNIGWMMGPWLMFQLINGATIALFNGTTSTKEFCKFIECANVSMLGVIPSLVKTWYSTNATAECNWNKIRRFSSTGEASDPIAMHWLVSRVQGYCPIIEYCGGTEIGGSFLSSTMVQANVPSMFSSPVLGSRLVILNDQGSELTVSGSGEIALMPPILGLSTRLLNRNHHECYYDDMPSGPNGEILRRHGDEIEAVYDDVDTIATLVQSKLQISTSLTETTIKKVASSKTLPYYRALGRCDDTMNLGGIKISSVEIERVCNLTEGIHETAAIAIPPPQGGPSLLIIYVVLSPNNSSEENNTVFNNITLKTKLQQSIKNLLNPLFHISDIVIASMLPRTASNKIMRRLLRDEYLNRDEVKRSNNKSTTKQ